MAESAETAEVDEDGMEDVVYVAVKDEYRESNSTLTWALRNLAKKKKVVLVHVHPPLQFVNLMGSSCPMSQANSEHVETQKLLEEEKMHTTLNKYASLCECFKVRAEKLTIEWIDVAEGLMELISAHGITKLVMGAASDKYYSKNMKLLKSKTARTVHTRAPPSCNVWFICRGNLICTREASENGNGSYRSPMASPGSTSTQSMTSPGPSTPSRPSPNPVRRFFKFMSNANSPRVKPSDLCDLKEQDLHTWDAVPVSSPSSYPSRVEIDDTTSQSGSNSILKDEESLDDSIMYHSVHDYDEENNLPFTNDQQEVSGVDDGLYDKLQELITEAEKLKYENFEESHKRHKAEREAAEAKRKIKALQMKIAREIKIREQTDSELKIQKMDLDELRSLHDNISEEFKATCDQKTALEVQLVACNSMILDLEKKLSKAQELSSLLELQRNGLQEEKLELRREREDAIREIQEGEKQIYQLRNYQDEMSEELRITCDEKRELEDELASHNSILLRLQQELLTANQMVNSLEAQKENLLRERDTAFREIEELRRVAGQSASTSMGCIFLEFSYSEIEQATRNFNDSLEIGVGGYGRVYKGSLRHTAVAIKVMSPLSLQGSPEFHCELEVLSRMRHPNLVTLMGACREAKALVYEYLPNGSLEDRLMCKRGSPPLSWQIRVRICAEVCCALIFLHSSRPQCVVHGDLKPENVLLDANFVSKLSDFGISRLLVPPTTTSAVYHQTDPKGTYVYMDPEFLATGMLTTQSDVYAFGILILRILTGKRPLGIVKVVQDALDERRLQGILDPTAGEWPFVLAQQLAYLGLRCSAITRERRPDLVNEVLTVLEPMTRVLSGPFPTSYLLEEEENTHIPSYFLCPIFQEIMRDPQVAADGFTYEAEALKGWLESGHDTSPMTNVKLSSNQLIPNHSLRSAIHEWLQQRRRQWS